MNEDDTEEKELKFNKNEKKLKITKDDVSKVTEDKEFIEFIVEVE